MQELYQASLFPAPAYENLELNTLLQGDDLEQAFSPAGKGLPAVCDLAATCWAPPREV